MGHYIDQVTVSLGVPLATGSCHGCSGDISLKYFPGRHPPMYTSAYYHSVGPVVYRKLMGNLGCSLRHMGRR